MRVAFCFALAAFPSLSAAQGRPAITPADYGKWESIGSATLSPDGRWLAYTVNRVDERNELRVRRLDHDTSFVLSLGMAPVFAANSKWLAYTINVAPDEREKLERDKKPVRTSIGLVDLSSGASVTLAQAASYRFSGDARFIAVRLNPAEGAKRDAANLLVRTLATGATLTFGNVGEYSWSDAPTTALLAMTLDAEDGVGNGLQLLDASTGAIHTLASSSDKYRGLAWRRDSRDLAVLRSESTSGFKDTTHVVMAWRGVGLPTAKTYSLDPAASGALPSELRIAEQAQPEWTRDGSGILVGLRPRTASADTSAKNAREKISDVQIWHARDVRPIPQQKSQELADLRRTLLGVWRVGDPTLLQVGTDLLEPATTSYAGNRSIVASEGRFVFGEMFGRQRYDLDAVDLRTGSRKRLADSVAWTGTLSPSGQLFSYFKGGTWWIVNAETGATINASAKASTTFEDRKDDHPLEERGPWGLAGWSTDDRWLYVYDQYDLWRLASDGSRAERLTKGAESQVVHRVPRIASVDQRAGIDPLKPLYISMYGEWTKESGYARLTPGQPLSRIVWGAANFSRLLKADSSTTIAFTRERFDESPNWHVVSSNAPSEARRVSDTNPFQKDYAWGRSELVDFKNDSGVRLQGALYYPVNYDPSKKYPMIVNTYEILSNLVNVYLPPSERTYYNRTVWTSRGYFVYSPDIVFRPGDPGRSYMESLVPGVKAVIARGLVDSAHVGLIGHSWGGYEAAYAPTQTNLFATSIAGAPITNFLSFAGAFHWAPGIPEFTHWETGQARMIKPPWEDFEGHVRNSPAAFVNNLNRPMLMVFGDADGTVDWHQGVEFYNFARRAGKEDFVMLVYPGEDHALRKKENQIDYHRRILQWFGHWLKGEPAADWIKRGVTWEERRATISDRPQ